ncbi:hypothetical protein LKMONMHP_4427 [Methylobacterium organophilum]|uniref:Uncharacterized protein n=1 Tax=Methylobacterium organophilum TaxID=410 RepID=A0ABQ4THC2_METOR|nr:hypothetical protein LKMONMHP_4427 [Methylobacterium organophilum]
MRRRFTNRDFLTPIDLLIVMLDVIAHARPAGGVAAVTIHAQAVGNSATCVV